MCERDVNRGRAVGGLSTSSESDSSDWPKAKGSCSSSCRLSSTDAGCDGDSGDRGLVVELVEGSGLVAEASSDLKVGRLGVDLE